jgi:hypothetical protein
VARRALTAPVLLEAGGDHQLSLVGSSAVRALVAPIGPGASELAVRATAVRAMPLMITLARQVGFEVETPLSHRLARAAARPHAPAGQAEGRRVGAARALGIAVREGRTEIHASVDPRGRIHTTILWARGAAAAHPQEQDPQEQPERRPWASVMKPHTPPPLIKTASPSVALFTHGLPPAKSACARPPTPTARIVLLVALGPKAVHRAAGARRGPAAGCRCARLGRPGSSQPGRRPVPRRKGAPQSNA